MVYDVVGSTATEVPEDLVASFGEAPIPAEWPTQVPAPENNGALCAELHPESGEAPAVSLATNPTGAADPTDIAAGSHDVDVEPSAGAYVLSGSDESTDGGQPFVIDTKGEKYELIGPEVPDFIGYGAVEPPVVPSYWMVFFEPGVPLSTNSARRVPAEAPPAEDSEADAG
jgi:hypothetical protein